MIARLARILIHPIKSLDAVDVRQSEVLPSGALRHDRRYALVDADGNVVNGKRTPAVHRLRAGFDLERGLIELLGEGCREAFHLEGDRAALEAALSRALEQTVRLLENAQAGFPDDLESPGPTLVSTPTLRAVAGWFAGLDESEVRRRFRANLEIDGACAESAGDESAGDAAAGGPMPAFWEDRLCGAEAQHVRFRVGSVVFAGTNPCQRCIVPTRDAATGEAWPRFAKAFAEQRQAALPAWAERSRFDHFYRLAVNTRLAGENGVIRVGDAVEMLPQ